MRILKTLPLLLALSLIWSGTALTGASALPEALKKPMTIEAGSNPRLSVVFHHTTHKDYKCSLCHHETSGDDANIACVECHSIPGGRLRDPMSMFMAFHSLEAGDRSCLGCHKRLAREEPGKYGKKFAGCHPCHLPVKGR